MPLSKVIRDRLEQRQVGVSSCEAIGMTLMSESVPIDRLPGARATVSRPQSVKPATVSTSALAAHLDCSRTHIGKLEAKA